MCSTGSELEYFTTILGPFLAVVTLELQFVNSNRLFSFVGGCMSLPKPLLFIGVGGIGAEGAGAPQNNHAGVQKVNEQSRCRSFFFLSCHHCCAFKRGQMSGYIF